MYAGRTWRATSSRAKLCASSCARYARTTGCSSARAILRAVPDRTDVAAAIERVVRRGREIGPVRLDVRQVQHPRRLALRPDPVERAIGEVRGLGVLLAHARRQVGVAHLPARHDAPAVVRGDHVVAPRVGARVAVRPQKRAVAGLGAGGQMAVVALDRRRSRPRAAARRARTRPRCRSARTRRRQAARASCRRAWRRGPRRAGSRPACARRRTAGRCSMSRRVSSHTGPCRTTSATGRTRRTGRTRCRSGRRAGRAVRDSACGRARRSTRRVAPQLVAHDEQHVAGGAHRRGR